MRDLGYLVGPSEVIFKVLKRFANEIREGAGCEPVAGKCKMFSLDEGAWKDCMARDLISDGLQAIEEGLI